MFTIFFRFNEVLVETGLLLIHPLLKDADTSRAMIQAASTINRDKMKMLLRRRGRGLSIMTKMPMEGIKGNQCMIDQTKEKMWYPHQVKNTFSYYYDSNLIWRTDHVSWMSSHHYTKDHSRREAASVIR